MTPPETPLAGTPGQRLALYAGVASFGRSGTIALPSAILLAIIAVGDSPSRGSILIANARSRLEDIDELMTFSSNYKHTADFLSEMALLTNMDAEQDRHAGRPTESIRLTTVHQAKGLEWKAVFVIWLVDGMFPAARSLEEAASESEERRLFYVAVTRAKDYLWLCVPRLRKVRDGGVMMCTPSRFIDEIDPGLLQIDQPGGFVNTPRWARW